MAAIAAVFIAGCATYIPVQKEAGNFSLSYTSTAQGQTTPEVVAIVSPEFGSQDASRGNSVNYQLTRAGMVNVDKSQFIAAESFSKNYQKQFASAIHTAVEEMFQKRGFKTKGPYEAYEDVTYTDKKTLYLISNPKINLYFDQTVTDMSCRNGNQVCKAEGTIRLRGEIVYRLQEPLTGQAMLTKRFDIGSLGISREYIKEFQSRTVSQGLSGALWDKMVSPDKLFDNTDKVLTDAIA